MKDPDQIFKKQMRLEGCFFIEGDITRITAIYVFFFPGLEIGVWSVVLLHLLIAEILSQIIFDQPDVGILCFFEDTFKS